MRDKRAKFVELANARVTRAIKDIRLIGNLSNKSAYEFTEDDVDRIVRALRKELEAIKARFGGGGASDAEFKLDE
ncbi:MAG TPA: hypothetical protein VIM56_11280 [Rhizomicrobium sp.]